MHYCTKCGKKLDDRTLFCPECGTPVAKPAQSKGFDPKNIDFNGEDKTCLFSPADAEQNKYLCILCYLGILLLIPLLVKRDSAYTRFHCNQGLVLLLAGLAGSLLGIVPLVGTLVGWVVSVGVLVLRIMGIVNTCSGKAKTLPLLGGLQLLD